MFVYGLYINSRLISGLLGVSEHAKSFSENNNELFFNLPPFETLDKIGGTHSLDPNLLFGQIKFELFS